MATSSLSALTVTRLAIARGGRGIFKDLSFSLEAGHALSLEGPNGAGKTSLLRVLGGFLPPLAGRVVLATGRGAVSEPEERGRHVGWLGHQDGIKPQLTVLENLAFYASLYGASGARLKDTLAEVGLARAVNLPGQYLSAGMKKRLALARLIVSGRPLWLMDEPLAALDVKGKALVAGLIDAHCAKGGLVIAATHEPLGLGAFDTLTVGAA